MVVISAALIGAAHAAPQTADVPPATTLHAEARVVQIDVVVTDSHGKPITDLTKMDFTISDNGKPRGIDIFSINRSETDPGPSAPAAPALQATPGQHLPPNTFSNRNVVPPNLPGHSTVIVLDQVNAFLKMPVRGASR
jgi:VWFA-related protein